MISIFNQKRNFYFLLILLLSLLNCRNDLQIQIDANKKYIMKKMENHLIINLKSQRKENMPIYFVLHNLTDDISDMPLFKKELMVYPGTNLFMIQLNEIGEGKYSLRLMDDKDKLIDYRILEITP